MNIFDLNAFDLSDPQRTISQLDHEILELYQNGEIERAIQLAASFNKFTKQIWEDRLEQYYEIGLSLNIFSLDKMAWLYRTIEDFPSAEICYQEVLKVRRDVLGENHPHVIQSFKNLISFYKEIGETIKAEPFLVELTEIRSKILGSRSPEFAGDLIQLAEFYREIENYDRAETILLEALDICRNAFGEVHLAVAACLDQLSTLYSVKKNFAEAIAPLQQASDIWLRLQGDKSLSVAVSLCNLAFLYEKIGNFANTISLYHEALESYRKIQGKELEVADILEKLVKLYYSRDDYRQALPLCREVLELRNQMEIKNEFKIAGDTVVLAKIYDRLGIFKEARDCLSLVEGFCQSEQNMSENSLDVASLFNDLAAIYNEMGDYKKSVGLYQTAIETLVHSFGLSLEEFENRIDISTDQNPLEIATFSMADDQLSLAVDSLNGLGMVYFKSSSYKKAKEYYQKSLRIHNLRPNKENLRLAGLYSNFGLLNKAIGNFHESKKLYEKALDIYKNFKSDPITLPDSINLSIVLVNLAGVLYSTENYDGAKSFYEEALQLQLRILNPDSYYIAMTLNGLGAVNYVVGDYEQAREYQLKALKIYRKNLGESHPMIALSLFQVAEVNAAIGHVTEAFAYMRQAESIRDEAIGEVFSITSESARMSYLREIRENFNVFMSLLVGSFLESSSEIELGFNLALRRKAIGIEVLAIQQSTLLAGRYPHLKTQLSELIQLRNQIGQKALSGPGLEGLVAHQDKLAEWNQQKERIEEELVRQIPEMNIGQRLQSVNLNQISELLPPDSALVEFVCFDSYDFKAVPAKGERHWKTARYAAFILYNGHPRCTSLIDLGEADPINQMIKSFRTFITRDQEESNRTIAHDDEAAYRHVRAVTPISSPFIDNSLALRAKVFDPLLPAMGNCKRLILAPDGDLSLIPFEVLPVESGKLLLDYYTISYLSTGRDVLRFGALSTGKTSPPIVAADPDFDLEVSTLDTALSDEPKGDYIDAMTEPSTHYSRMSQDFERGMHFGKLRGTRTEGERIAKLLNIRPWLEADVRESRLKACRSPQILHIATHGFFLRKQKGFLLKDDPVMSFLSFASSTQFSNEMQEKTASMGFVAVDHDGNEVFSERLSGQGIGLNNPLLRTGLALAGANTWLKNGILPKDAEDAILTAEDVTAMDLMGTEMVVLSACETALGEVQPGEGVFGLRRSFVLAGAKTLVMSLWKVPDKQTQELMENFYKRILAGQPRAEALRGAQLEMKKKYPNPFYWGAFICQGDPSPLKTLPSSASQHD